MGCRTCHWALPGLQNRNLFTKSLSTDSWYGTISIYNADNGTSIGSVNLGDPNQKMLNAMSSVHLKVKYLMAILKLW